MNISPIGWSHLGSLIVKNLQQPWHIENDMENCDFFVFWFVKILTIFSYEYLKGGRKGGCWNGDGDGGWRWLTFWGYSLLLWWFVNLLLWIPKRRRKGRLLEGWERRTRRLLFAGQRDAMVGLVKISMLIVSFHFTYMKPLSVCNDQSIHLHMLHQAPGRGKLALADIACQN